MWNFLSTAIQDIRFALRTLRKNPGFTCAALITLALGIGANTAIYSVIDGVVLHPVPFSDPDRLVALYQKTRDERRTSISYPNLLDWQRRSQTFEAIAGARTDGFTMTGKGEPEAVRGMMVSASLFSVLRVQPVLGRTFTTDEDQQGARRVALLGEDFWKRRFAADPKIIGQTLTLNHQEYDIIGVMPASVRLERDRISNTFINDIFTPIGQFDLPIFYQRGTGNGTMGLGRLKPGVTLPQARNDMETIMRELVAEYPAENGSNGVTVISLKEDVASDLRPTVLALGAAVGFLLLIACTNVANLALAQSNRRSQELGIRIVLGAARSRLIRQLLTESALLSLAGGAIGVFVASWCVDAALAALPSVVPAVSQVHINQHVLLFSLAVSVLTGFLFGFAPAVKAVAGSLHETLKSGRGATKRRHYTHDVLIIAEVALTLVLLIGAGLMIRTLNNLWNVSPGFDPQGVLFFYTALSPARAAKPETVRASLRELNDRLSAIPGVESASIQAGGLPFLGNTTIGFASEEDSETSNTRDLRTAHMYGVGPDHFRTMGIPILRGRGFTPQDNENNHLVTVVDEELGRIVFPGQDPIGKHIRVFGRSVEIVGIARHIKHSGLDSDSTDKVQAQFYFPITQLPERILGLLANAVAGIVRSRTAPAALMSSIRHELDIFDSGQAVTGDRLMVDAIAGSLAQRRFSLIVLAAFAATALVLSLVGVYGVISYLVGQRTREIGVRIALGARPRSILADVLKYGAKLGTIGIILGALGAAALSRLISSLLFGVSPTDLRTFGLAAILLFALTLAACLVPARRAVHIDPMLACRYE